MSNENAQRAFAVVANPDGNYRAIEVDGLDEHQITSAVMIATGRKFCYETNAGSADEAVQIAKDDGFAYAPSEPTSQVA